MFGIHLILVYLEDLFGGAILLSRYHIYFSFSRFCENLAISPNPLLIAETLSNNVISVIIGQHPPFISVVNDIPDIFSRILINRHNYIVAAS